MQVLTDAQWAKFEEAIRRQQSVAPDLDARIGARSRRSSGGWTTARSGARSRRSWATGITLICASAAGRSAVSGTRSWPISSIRESRNWHWPASTGRPRVPIRRHLGRGPAKLRPKPLVESATHSRCGQQGRGAGPFAWRVGHQDRRRLRCGRATGRLSADARPGSRACTVVDIAAAPAQGAVLGHRRHGVRCGTVPPRSTRPGRHSRCSLSSRSEGATAVPRRHLLPPQSDRTLPVASERAKGSGHPLRQDRRLLRSRRRNRSINRLDQTLNPIVKKCERILGSVSA
jgi:hypothetical protein